MTKKSPSLYGEGGGGSAKKPTIHPDGLFSQSLMEAVVAVSEGPIAGLLNKSFQHIFLDDTPVIAATGEDNFEAHTIALGLNRGDELSPTAIPFHLKGTGIAYGVNAVLKQHQPVIRTTPAIRRGLFNQLEVILNLQRLVLSNNEGQFRTTLKFEIEYRQSGATDWTTFPGSPFTVNDKTTTGVKLEYKAKVSAQPEAQDYDIRVTRLSKDSDTQYLADIQWEAYEVVLTHDQSASKRRHADLAMLHVLGYSNDQFSSLPAISGIYGGLMVPVPTNYNPKTRTYDESSPWDGRFTSARYWTDNPFWLIRELVMNERFGMRKYQPLVTINDYELYRLAKDADQMVGTPPAPRYTFNGVLAEPKAGMETLRYIAGTAFANVYDDGRGNLTVVGERPYAPVMLLTPESVEAPEQGDDVTFNYSFTDTKERYNVIHASFVNPNRGWDLEPLPAKTLSNLPEDQDPTVQRFGAQPLDLELPGCIYEHEGNRKTVRILVEANTETVLTNCTLPMAGQLLQLGDVVLLGDAEMGWGMTGRLRAVEGAQVTLTAPIQFEQTGTYTLKVQGYLGIETVTFTVSAPGVLTTLTCSEALEDIPPFASFVIEHPQFVGQAQTFRVMSLDEAHGIPGKYQVQLKLLNMAKFDAEEQAYFAGLPDREFVASSVTPPQNVQAEFIRERRDGDTKLVLHVSWARSSKALRYEVWAGSDTGTGFQMLGETPTTELFVEVPPNNYQVFVRAIGLIGSADSTPVVVTLVKITAAHLAAHAGQVVVTELTTGFQRRDLHFNVKLGFREVYQGQTFMVDLFNLSTLPRIFISVKDRVSGTHLRDIDLPRTGVVYTYEQQLFDLDSPSGKLDVDLYIEDYLGDRFGPLQFQFSANTYPEILAFHDESRPTALIVNPEHTYDVYPRPNVTWFIHTQDNFEAAREVMTGPMLQYTNVAEAQVYFVWGYIDTPFGRGKIFPSREAGFRARVPLSIEPPTKPTGLVVTPGSTSAMLQWNTPPNYGGMHTRIYRQETPLKEDGTPLNPSAFDPFTMMVGATPGVTYTDPKLKSNTGYYYWITHVNGRDEESEPHAMAGTLAITIRDPEDILREISGSISWDDLDYSTHETLQAVEDATETVRLAQEQLEHGVQIIENQQAQLNDYAQQLEDQTTELWRETQRQYEAITASQKTVEQIRNEVWPLVDSSMADALAGISGLIENANAQQRRRKAWREANEVAAAEIERLETIIVDDQHSLAQLESRVSSEFNRVDGRVNSEVHRIDLALTDTNTALSQVSQSLMASLGNLDQSYNARVTNLSTALTDTNTALSQVEQTLTASLSTMDSKYAGKVTQLTNALATTDSILASTRSMLEASLEDLDGSMAASINDLSESVIALGQALARTETELRAEFKGAPTDPGTALTLHGINNNLNYVITDPNGALALAKKELRAQLTGNADGTITNTIKAVNDALNTAKADLTSAISTSATTLKAEIIGQTSDTRTSPTITGVNKNLDFAMTDPNGALALAKKELRAELTGNSNGTVTHTIKAVNDALNTAKADLTSAISTSATTLKAEIIGQTSDTRTSPTITGVNKNLDFAMTDPNGALALAKKELRAELTGNSNGTVTHTIKAVNDALNTAKADLTSAISTSATTLKAEIIGQTSDTTSAPTITGVNKRLDATRTTLEGNITTSVNALESKLVGKDTDGITALTIKGLNKKVDTTKTTLESAIVQSATELKAEIIGQPTDTRTSPTITGVNKNLDFAMTNANGALAQAKKELRAQLSGNIDGVITHTIKAVNDALNFAIADPNGAVSQSVSNLKAEIIGKTTDGRTALTIRGVNKNLDFAMSDPNGALAQTSKTLMAQLTGDPNGNITATINQAMSAATSVDGKYNAQWGVKTSVGSLQGGVGFFNDGTKTRFLVNSDVFAIRHSTLAPNGLVPFVVQDGAVHMNMAIAKGMTVKDLTVTGNSTFQGVVNAIGGVSSGMQIKASSFTNGKATIDTAGNLWAKDAILDNVLAKNGTYQNMTVSGTVTGNAATFRNITIAENCDVKGTIYANRIIGDVVSYNRVSLSRRNHGEGVGSTNVWYNLYDITFEADTKTRIFTFDSLGVEYRNCTYELELVARDGNAPGRLFFYSGGGAGTPYTVTYGSNDNTRTEYRKATNLHKIQVNIAPNTTKLTIRFRRTQNTGTNELVFLGGAVDVLIHRRSSLLKVVYNYG